MEACLSIKFAYLDWLTCKECSLGGHGKARRTVIKCPIVMPAIVNTNILLFIIINIFGTLVTNMSWSRGENQL